MKLQNGSNSEYRWKIVTYPLEPNLLAALNRLGESRGKWSQKLCCFMQCEEQQENPNSEQLDMIVFELMQLLSN